MYQSTQTNVAALLLFRGRLLSPHHYQDRRGLAYLLQ